MQSVSLISINTQDWIYDPEIDYCDLCLVLNFHPTITCVDCIDSVLVHLNNFPYVVLWKKRRIAARGWSALAIMITSIRTQHVHNSSIVPLIYDILSLTGSDSFTIDGTTKDGGGVMKLSHLYKKALNWKGLLEKPIDKIETRKRKL
jgi:hypothetical protein